VKSIGEVIATGFLVFVRNYFSVSCIRSNGDCHSRTFLAGIQLFALF